MSYVDPEEKAFRRRTIFVIAILVSIPLLLLFIAAATIYVPAIICAAPIIVILIILYKRAFPGEKLSAEDKRCLQTSNGTSLTISQKIKIALVIVVVNVILGIILKAIPFIIWYANHPS